MAEIKKTGERIEVTRDYEVTGAEPIQIRHRKNSLVPQRVTVLFRDGKWTRLTIYGGQARNDGTPGASQRSVEYGADSWYDDELPEWAVPLTEYRED